MSMGRWKDAAAGVAEDTADRPRLFNTLCDGAQGVGAGGQHEHIIKES
jgi:hypothetical protein